MKAQILALDGFFALKTFRKWVFRKSWNLVQKCHFWGHFEKSMIFEFFEIFFFCWDWEAEKKSSSADMSRERVLSGYRALAWPEVRKRNRFWLVVCFFKLKSWFLKLKKDKSHFLKVQALSLVFPLSLILLYGLSDFSQDEFGVYRLDRG